MDRTFASIGQRSALPRRCAWVVAALFALTTPHAAALDVSRKLAVPVPIADSVLEVGGRRLRLPPGRWVLTGRGEVETVGYARGGDAWGRGVSAWATLVEDGRLRAPVSCRRRSCCRR